MLTSGKYYETLKMTDCHGSDHPYFPLLGLRVWISLTMSEWKILMLRLWLNERG